MVAGCLTFGIMVTILLKHQNIHGNAHIIYNFRILLKMLGGNSVRKNNNNIHMLHSGWRRQKERNCIILPSAKLTRWIVILKLKCVLIRNNKVPIKLLSWTFKGNRGGREKRESEKESERNKRNAKPTAACRFNVVQYFWIFFILQRFFFGCFECFSLHIFPVRVCVCEPVSTLVLFSQIRTLFLLYYPTEEKMHLYKSKRGKTADEKIFYNIFAWLFSILSSYIYV